MLFFVGDNEPIKTRQKPDKMGTFFDCVLSYDRDKKTNVNNSPKRRYLRTLIFCTWEFVQLIGGRFFYGQTRRRTFPLSSVHSDVSNDYEGR